MFFEEMATNTVNSYPEEVWKTGVVLIASQFANRIREEYSTADLSDVELANMAMAAVSASCLGIKRVPYLSVITGNNDDGKVDVSISLPRFGVVDTPERDFDDAVREWMGVPDPDLVSTDNDDRPNIRPSEAVIRVSDTELPY